MENVRKHGDIKLVTTDKKRNKFVSEPNYHKRKRFSENLLAIEIKKTKVKMNKPVYLGMPVLHISKTLMYEFWYDYIKPKYRDRAKLCYNDTDSFLIYILAENIYEDISDDVERWFDAYIMDDDSEKKKAKGTKKCVIKRILMYENYKDCLFNDEVILRSQQ